jgi:hypothetical protein
MIIILNSPGDVAGSPARQRLATAAAWVLLLALLAFFSWSVFSNPQPGPYGVCYGSRGQSIPCTLPKTR